jgi:hypothetical protein
MNRYGCLRNTRRQPHEGEDPFRSAVAIARFSSPDNNHGEADAHLTLTVRRDQQRPWTRALIGSLIFGLCGLATTLSPEHKLAPAPAPAPALRCVIRGLERKDHRQCVW